MEIIPMLVPLKDRRPDETTKLMGDFCISAKASKKD